jgi:hypothetical protein
MHHHLSSSQPYHHLHQHYLHLHHHHHHPLNHSSSLPLLSSPLLSSLPPQGLAVDSSDSQHLHIPLPKGRTHRASTTEVPPDMDAMEAMNINDANGEFRSSSSSPRHSGDSGDMNMIATLSDDEGDDRVTANLVEHMV